MYIRYRYTILLVISIVAVALWASTESFDFTVRTIDRLGYLGVFVVGMLFVSTFTVAPATVVLFRLTESGDLFLLSLVAGAGAVCGDLILYNYLRDKVFIELKPFFGLIGRSSVGRLFQSHYLAWSLPVLGALIIASPLPDELGIALLGGSKFKRWQFITLSYILNTIGIFVIVTVAQII
jgi:hypothetical protein